MSEEVGGPAERLVPVTGVVVPDAWEALRRFTPARIALGRAGESQPTSAHLAFQLAHAQARDAVHDALETDRLERDVAALGLGVLRLHSAAADRATYLRRPDLGRQLDAASRRVLDAFVGAGALAARDRQRAGARPFDLAFVLADGLSARAVQQHAPPVLAETLRQLQSSAEPWHVAPAALVEQGRVAVGDAVGERLGAAIVAVLIGERPGLSAADSLGIYTTWEPRQGRVDAERNCISNVRTDGLPPAEAARRLCRLLQEARRRRLTGVELKEEGSVRVAERSPNLLLLGGGTR